MGQMSEVETNGFLTILAYSRSTCLAMHFMVISFFLGGELGNGNGIIFQAACEVLATVSRKG